MMINVGDRVTYNGPLDSLRGKSGKLVRFQSFTPPRAIVEFDGDHRGHSIQCENIVPEGEDEVKNIKVIVTDTVAKLLAPVTADSLKERAVRKLGIAKNLESAARKAAEDAKKALADVGIVVTKDFAPSSTEVVFDSERYSLTAVTNAGSERLDEPTLRRALAAYIGVTTINRVLSAAKLPIKPSTSLKVESK